MCSADPGPLKEIVVVTREEGKWYTLASSRSITISVEFDEKVVSMKMSPEGRTTKIVAGSMKGSDDGWAFFAESNTKFTEGIF